MRRRSFLPETLGIAACFGLTLPLAARQTAGADVTDASEGAFPSVAVVAQDGPTIEPLPAFERPGVDAGLPRIEERSLGRRPVPLPNRARWVEGEEGDQLVADASGDPHFIGFIGAQLRPAAGERVDGLLVERLVRGAHDSRPAAMTYAYAMLDFAATPELAAELEAAGARVLGFRPHNAFALALDSVALAHVEALDFVRWVGVARNEHKMHPRLADAFEGVEPGARGAIIVSVFDTDLHSGSRVERLAPTEVAGPGVRETYEAEGARWRSEGWQQFAIEALGAEVVEYLPSIRAFRIRATASELMRIVERDFVEFVEAEQPSFAMHDDSQPMIGTDYTRATYDGNWSGEAIGGEIDSGIDVSHTGLDHIWYLGWSLTGQSAWSDSCPHGSHVAGSILARPHAALAELAGAAPALGTLQTRSFRNVKFMEQNPNPTGNNCIGVGGSSLENRFSLMRNEWSNGQFTAPRPHFVNNSWGTGATAGGWIGSEANSRSVDAEVWNENQVYVFAAGNGGPGASTLSQEASAKNAVSVGNVLPYNSATVGAPSTLWTSSSRGPTGDARWKPNVVAPGRRIVSADAHTGNGYAEGTGTSMAAPHVAGVIAQMVDRHSFLRYAPARVASVLMATAHTKGGVTLGSPAAPHLSQYGAGRVDAVRAVQPDAQHSWNNWGFTLGANQTAMEDFTVAAGAQRLVVVMHYVEQAASAGASKALVNDFDLVLDAAPFAAAIDQGDFFTQQSDTNNTEIRILDNPQIGQWRWKIHPVAATSSVRMSVTVHVIYGDPLPNPTLTLSADKAFVKPNEIVSLSATVANPSHVASAVYLDTVGTNGATLLSSQMTLKDGLVANLADNSQGSNGLDATLGNIRFGTNRRVDWTASWASQGTKTWSVNGTSDNGMNRSAQVQVVVDGTPPGVVTNLQSSSHTAGVWTASTNILLNWTAATDNLSGILGYARSVTTSPSLPPTVMNVGAVTNTSTGPLTASANGRYVNLRAVDKSGNWSGSYVSAGPFLIDDVAPGVVSNLVSTSHQPNVWSNVPVVSVQWLHAPDTHSGVDGYCAAWNVLPLAAGHTKNVGAVTTLQSQAFASSLSGRWLSLRAIDKANNWANDTALIGPFRIDVTPPVISGVGFANEVAATSVITAPTLFVTIAAADVHSGLSQMRLKNDNGAWSPWMPFASVIQWDLTSYGGSLATGTRSVDVEVRDVAGNVTGNAGSVYYYKPHSFFGTAGIGAAGAPGVEVEGIFGVGKMATVKVTNTTAPWRRLVLGISQTQWEGLPLPLDLAIIGAPGNALLVSPDVVLHDGVADTAHIAIPPAFGGVGKTFFLQWLLFADPSGAAIVTSEGIRFEVNGA